MKWIRKESMRVRSFLWLVLLLTVPLFFAPVSASAQQLAAPTQLPGTAPSEPDPISVHTQLVSFSTTVKDNQGRYLSGLEQAAFTIYEDGIAQELSFFRVDDGPASIAVIFDF